MKRESHRALWSLSESLLLCNETTDRAKRPTEDVITEVSEFQTCFTAHLGWMCHAKIMRWGFLNGLLPKRCLCTWSCSIINSPRLHVAYLSLVRVSSCARRCWRDPFPVRTQGLLSGTHPPHPPPWTPLSATKSITGVRSKDYWAGEMPAQEGRKRIIRRRKCNNYLHTSNMSQELSLGLDFKGTWSRGLVYTTG